MKTKTLHIIENKHDIKLLLWLIKALSTDDSRFILQRVHVEADAIVATDGRRLHKIDTSKRATPMLPNGDFTVISKTKKRIMLALEDDEAKYPKWRQAMPKDEKFTVSRELTVFKEFIARVTMITSVPVNDQFVKDALGITTLHRKFNCVKVTIESSGSLSPIKITDASTSSCTAIIMPLRMND